MQNSRFFTKLLLMSIVWHVVAVVKIVIGISCGQDADVSDIMGVRSGIDSGMFFADRVDAPWVPTWHGVSGSGDAGGARKASWGPRGVPQSS